MSDAYTPALSVTPRTTVAKVRELPLPGNVLVAKGDRVSADTAVLSAELPGDLDILRLADRMGLDADLIEDGLRVAVGDSVKQGDLLCEVYTFFGLLRSEQISPVSAVVEFFTQANAHLGLRHPPTPISVDAYIDGTVVDCVEGKSVTVETEAALIQGIFGVGGESRGTIRPLSIDPDALVTSEYLASAGIELTRAVLVGGSAFSIDALQYCAEKDVAAVMTGSIDADTLRTYIGFEIGVSITGDEAVPFPLIISEGFGRLPISKRIMELAWSEQGRLTSVNGATQVRAGAMRPELIIPRDAGSDPTAVEAADNSLKVGCRIRVVRFPYFGKFGTVTELPHEPEKVESGAVVRVLRAALDDGAEATIPRANVELL